MRREVEIVNPLGLHARPAAEFVRWARRFQAEVRLIHDGQAFSAASILELLSAHLPCGAKVILEAVGAEEQAALERLSLLLLEFRDREIAERCLRESPPP